MRQTTEISFAAYHRRRLAAAPSATRTEETVTLRASGSETASPACPSWSASASPGWACRRRRPPSHDHHETAVAAGGSANGLQRGSGSGSRTTRSGHETRRVSAYRHLVAPLAAAAETQTGIATATATGTRRRIGDDPVRHHFVLEALVTGRMIHIQNGSQSWSRSGHGDGGLGKAICDGVLRLAGAVSTESETVMWSESRTASGSENPESKIATLSEIASGISTANASRTLRIPCRTSSWSAMTASLTVSRSLAELQWQVSEASACSADALSSLRSEHPCQCW